MKGKAMLLILVLVFSTSIPTALSDNALSVSYAFEPTVGGCGEFLVANTQIQEIAGEPAVPYRAARILLPQGATIKDVKVKTGTPIVQMGIDIPWGQIPATFSGPAPEKVGKNEAIYNSMNWYPNNVFKVVSVDSFRGFDILNVILYPVQYQPKSKTVKIYTEMTVEVQFGKGMKNKLYRGLESDKTAVSGMVDNPETTSTYEDGGTPLATEEYIIITSSTLESTFQSLADWKNNFLTGAGVYTVSWITSNYTGVDNAEKIRNFIIDKYTNNGLKYVLLGGDIAEVPYRGFYIYSGGYTDYDMLADMYFSHLDGNWNDDGDSYWAEPGEEDWYAEIGVGRAPCENTSEAQNFVNKVIAYEQMDKPERALLHESRVVSGNSPDARCLAWNCETWLPASYTKDYLFEEDGGISKQIWIDHWAMDPIVVAHIGHGAYDCYYINYEVDLGHVTWYNSDVASLTNTFWPWNTTVACHTGEIEVNDCLAEVYVMDPDNGAIVSIHNDNYGWFSYGDACMYSGEFCEMEFRACWSDGYEKFGDMLNQCRSYLVSSAASNSTYRWCFYERNIVGDPESPSLTKRIVGDDVTITNPSDGETVKDTVDITTSTSGCIDTVEFYIDSTLKYTDTTAPFEWAWDTTLYAEGDHTIEVKGYCSGVYKDNHIITVTVDNIPEPFVTITNPSDGETVSGVYTCTADSNCDSVKWYIDGVFKEEDASEPFEYVWDTTQETNSDHTVKAEGYNSGLYQCEDIVTCTVDNAPQPPSVTITYPPDGATISGVVTVTTDTTGVDEVRFYVNGALKHTDYTEPFTWDWDTTQYKNRGGYKLLAEGYYQGSFGDSDQIRVKISNPSIALLSFLLFFLPAGIVIYKK
jgi:hypothetical protein